MCLSFKCHAKKMASKTQKAVASLNMLGKIIQRVKTKVMRQAVYIYILPILTYGTPAWWPGRICLNKQGKTIQNGLEGQLKRLDKVQNITLRSILQQKAATAPIKYIEPLV